MDILQDFSLRGTTVFVTGATSGIGHGIALACAEAGATVAAIGRNPERLEKLRQELTSISTLSHFVSKFDVTNYPGMPELIKAIVAQCGKIGGFVHSAGIAETIPLKMSNSQLYHNIFDVNTTSSFEFIRIISAKKYVDANASYVLISSVAAVKGESGLVAYSASKGALLSGCRSLASELAKKKIRVNCIVPGLVMDTDMGKHITEILPADKLKQLYDAHLFGFGTIDQIAKPVIFFLSKASSWITGTSLTIDGGYTL